MSVEDLVTPHTEAQPKKHNADWWRDAVVYQIYPRSFADANGDGIGDLPGITSRLESLVTLGVDCIWLSPFYVSPGADAGYDVADYRDVDPMFGTLEDFDALLSRAHELGLKVIIDIVPNHCSEEHRWFQEALAATPGSPERERFLFRDGKGENGDEPPSNHPSSFFGSAWTRITEPDGTPGQWYFHLFAKEQPDWNWDNPEIWEEFRSILRFWLDRGVDGFRIDVANGFFKDPAFPDVPEHSDEGIDFYSSLFTFGDDDPTNDHGANERIHQVYRDWNSVLSAYNPPRILTGEVWGPPRDTAPFVRPDEMQQVFNFPFLEAGWRPDNIRNVIRASLEANGAVGAATTWVLSNHDVVRHASRLGYPPNTPRWNGIGPDDPQPNAELGLARAQAATLMMLALPGSSYFYQGEELGLPEHTTLDGAVRQDPTWIRSEGEYTGRDGCRIPLPWEADRPALGFNTTGEAWLPQPESYKPLARDRQAEDDESTLAFYRRALALRRERDLGLGTFTLETGFGDDVVAFRNADILSVTNMGHEAVEIPEGEVLLSSGHLQGGQLLPNTTAWISTSTTH
ncbi:MAG: glycoside hydrolase family 13 protein [Ancrocorticia sp.]